MGDEGKLYVPQELVSVYREKVSNVHNMHMGVNAHIYKEKGEKKNKKLWYESELFSSLWD